MRLAGKVAIITGGSSGIGRSTAILFGREGARVTVAARRRDWGEETVARVKEAGGEAIFVPTDVAQSRQVREMVEATVAAFGKIDVLFNNAGISPPASWASVVDTPEEVWDEVMAVNLKGVFLCSKFAVPEMIKAGGGSIINNASILAVGAKPNRAAYCSAKGGVNLLTKSMAIDFARYKIRVNCICPAFVETDLALAIRERQMADGTWEKVLANHPLGIGKPEDVAQAALYFASDESRWVSGTTLLLDGARSARVGE